MKWSLRQYLIAFNMVPGIGGRRLLGLKNHFGSLDKAWHAPWNQLTQVEGMGPKTVQSFCAIRSSVCPRAEEAWARGYGAQIITLCDENYPDYLRRLVVPPPVLYVQGALPEKPGIAVVGTRKPSRIGVAQARQFTAGIVEGGETVISGLARGIDYVSHELVVRMGGKGVAVLGSNIGKLYPSEHRGLAEKIAEDGAVVSEFSSRCSTVPGNFPRRNRIIAGCSRGVLVVQAGAKSGAIRTADWALEMGLDVWSIPGEISDPLREGNHNLIKQGAYLVSGPEDLIQSIPQRRLSISPSLETLYKAGHHANEIAATLNLPIPEVLAEISRLQVVAGKRI